MLEEIRLNAQERRAIEQARRAGRGGLPCQYRDVPNPCRCLVTPGAPCLCRPGQVIQKHETCACTPPGQRVAWVTRASPARTAAAARALRG